MCGWKQDNSDMWVNLQWLQQLCSFSAKARNWMLVIDFTQSCALICPGSQHRAFPITDYWQFPNWQKYLSKIHYMCIYSSFLLSRQYTHWSQYENNETIWTALKPITEAQTGTETKMCGGFLHQLPLYIHNSSCIHCILLCVNQLFFKTNNTCILNYRTRSSKLRKHWEEFGKIVTEVMK